MRYLVGDVPDLAERARRIVDDGPSLLITEGAITDSGFVLTKRYSLPRESVVDALISLPRRDNVTVVNVNKELVAAGLSLRRPSGRVSFADAMLWATARSTEVRTIYTFDARFPEQDVAVKREL